MSFIAPAWPTPNIIPNLALWLDANDDASFSFDAYSGVVNSWTDKSANARVFTPVSATLTSKPTRVRKRNWNNKTVLCHSLSGTTGMGSSAFDIASNFAANGTDITVFIVAHCDDANPVMNPEFNTVYYHYTTGAIGHYFRFNDSSGNVTNICLSTYPVINGSNANYVKGEKIIRLQRNGTTHSSFINGAQELVVTATPTPIVSTVTPMYVLCQQSIGGGGMVGDLAELIMYARALSTTECQKIENYLTAKWLGIN